LPTTRTSVAAGTTTWCPACGASPSVYVIIYSLEPNDDVLIVRVIPGDRDIPRLLRQ
jgi:plasmid stabilization system protein ParE